MLIFTILEIGLGLAFVYLLLSLLTSWFNELIANFLQLRAKGLEQGIRALLKDPPGFASDPAQYLADHPEYQGYLSFADQFYGHPLVKALTGHFPARARPSTIPARTFALVALDILFPEVDFVDKTVDQLKLLITSKHLHPDVETALLTLIEGGARDIEALRKGIETWFDDTMSQVSDWYRRGVSRRSLILGLLLAIVLNVDTLVVANTLWQEPSLRSGIASYLQQNLPQLQPGQAASAETVGQVRDALSAFDFPIGWTTFGPGPVMQKAAESGQSPLAGLLNWLLLRLIGWVLTGIAVSQGAPFWFDILRKVISPAQPAAPAKSGG